MAVRKDREGRRIHIRGTVQGVGFRPWICRLARETGVGGHVRNVPEGVAIEAFGPRPALERFLDALTRSAPPAAVVREIEAQAIPHEPRTAFTIAASESEGAVRVSIPPDLAACDECVAEIFDPADRRFRYPFTNCTACGPRFTIARDVPYDRPNTSMAAFPMCAPCRREYEDVADRRFHAQPNACPACGPRLRLLRSDGGALAGSDPLNAAARALADGSIVAIKGIGGYHLACDATSSSAVARLRARKRREEKPFAVMVSGLEEAERLVLLEETGRRLLTSVERPIVLAAGRAPTELAPEVAPGNPLVGLMLPYTPLHHLLLAEAGRPLVMTSGNLSDEPIAFQDAEAADRLAHVADLLLAHDREIVSRCEDSLVRVIAGSPVVLRRSRGYVPRPIPLRRPFDRPILAVGGHLKNVFCIGLDDAAWLGPHIGDLETLETCHAFEEALDRMERFLHVRPAVVAHDLHPDYASSRYALAREAEVRVGVQHHQAHVASAMAEHHLEGPVLGVAYDGTGFGTDGTAWGGELLLVREDGFDRLATTRPVRLPGGDAAIRDVWKIALALLEDAWDGSPPLEAFRLFDGLRARDVEVVRAMLARGVNSPPAHGVGRFFDGVGDLVLGRPAARYEGQVALEWNAAADERETSAYPYRIGRDGSTAVIDLRPLVRAASEDLLRGRSAGLISARFHNGLAAATSEVVRAAARSLGPLPVVLTGGCFQNALLAERVRARLAPDLRVHLHRDVPPGDGGLALGQALVADAVLRPAR